MRSVCRERDRCRDCDRRKQREHVDRHAVDPQPERQPEDRRAHPPGRGVFAVEDDCGHRAILRHRLLGQRVETTCVAPPLIGALAVIGQSGDVLRGATALFVLSIGMGTPLLLVGAAAGKMLPRVGPWMNAIKAGFGVMMIGMAGSPETSERPRALAVGAAVV